MDNFRPHDQKFDAWFNEQIDLFGTARDINLGLAACPRLSDQIMDQQFLPEASN